jgi:hypothetical protein
MAEGEARSDRENPPTDARSTLRSSSTRTSASAPQSADEPASPTAGEGARPRSLPGYEILEELGHGSTGFVFRARQANLDRDVAVKTARSSGPTDESHRVRFLTEALVTGSLDHPNVVPTHDLVFDEEGRPSLAMKLIGGVTWDELLHPGSEPHRERARDFDFDRHLEVLQAVCNAVAFAHSRGIIHRDLKPANVMVGEFGEVLVMDWGLAVAVEDPSRGDDGWRAPDGGSVTEPEGSPAYMAPEMAAGRGEALSRASDVYLLGAILFEIVTGAPPHLANSIAAALTAASCGERPPFPPDVPQELQAICERAMAARPEERYVDAADFQRALREFASHRQSLAVADAAAARLAASRERTAVARETGPAESYRDLAEAASGFRQAQLLWPDNARAIEGERQARIAHARIALENGDLALARILVEGLGGTEVEQLGADLETASVARERATRWAATRRRSLLAVAIVILALLFSSGFFLFSMHQVGNEIADQMRGVLTAEALLAMRRAVEEGARDLELVRSKSELALHIYAREIEAALAAEPAPPLAREPLWSSDIDAGRADASSLVDLPRYRRIESGRRIPSPVSLELQSFFVAAGADAGPAREEVARLERVLPTVRWLYGRARSVARFFAGIAATPLYVQYPGSGGLPPDYDPMQRDWYRLGLSASGIATTQPYRDQTTQQLVISAVTPLLVGERRVGVAGVDFDVESLLGGRRPDEPWAGEVRVSIARLEGTDELRVFALAGRVPGAADDVGQVPTLRIELTPGDPDLPLAFARVRETGHSEVVRTEDARGDWLWALAPIPQTKLFLTMAAPTETVTAAADDVERSIRGETSHQLARAVAHASLFLALVLAAIAMATLGHAHPRKRA